MNMKIILFLSLVILLFSCNKQESKAKMKDKYALSILTNDSIRFWEADPPIQNSRQGYSFLKDGKCDEFEVDSFRNRTFQRYNDIILRKPFSFTFTNDTLRLFTSDGFMFNYFRVLKIDKNTLVLQQTDTLKYDGGKTEIYTTTMKYIPAKDQKTKPRF